MQHPDQNSMEAFSRRALPPAELLAVSDHLAACDACREVAESLALGDRASRAEWFPAEDFARHLSEEEVAGAAADEKVLSADTRAHLAECEECRAEVDDVRRFFSPVAVMQPRKSATTAKSAMWAAGVGLIAAGLVLAVSMRHSQVPASVGNAPLVAELQDGPGLIGLDAHGQLAGVPALSAENSALLTGVFTTHRLPKAHSALAGSGDIEMLRGEAGTAAGFAVLSPLREKTSTIPEFRWGKLAGARSYQVEIHDDNFNLVALSPRLAETQWTPAKPLPLGRDYTWVVKADTAGGVVQSPQPPQPEARFAVLTEGDLASISAVRSQAADSHLLLAAIYAKLGMTSAAEAEMDSLEKQNPGSPLVDDLKKSLQKTSAKH